MGTVNPKPCKSITKADFLAPSLQQLWRFHQLCWAAHRATAGLCFSINASEVVMCTSASLLLWKRVRALPQWPWDTPGWQETTSARCSSSAPSAQTNQWAELPLSRRARRKKWINYLAFAPGWAWTPSNSLSANSWILVDIDYAVAESRMLFWLLLVQALLINNLFSPRWLCISCRDATYLAFYQVSTRRCRADQLSHSDKPERPGWYLCDA